MMQGDSYGLKIEITTEDGTVITDTEVKDVEITVGRISKAMRDGVHYSNGVWVFPMEQEESFRFPSGYAKVQVRIVWPNGEVEGITLDEMPVDESVSKEVL